MICIPFKIAGNIIIMTRYIFNNKIKIITKPNLIKFIFSDVNNCPQVNIQNYKKP